MAQMLYAQDQAGNRHKVIQHFEAGQADGGDAAQAAARIVYSLDDGTPVRRVDNDTFQVVPTGAYITAVRE